MLASRGRRGAALGITAESPAQNLADLAHLLKHTIVTNAPHLHVQSTNECGLTLSMTYHAVTPGRHRRLQVPMKLLYGVHSERVGGVRTLKRCVQHRVSADPGGLRLASHDLAALSSSTPLIRSFASSWTVSSASSGRATFTLSSSTWVKHWQRIMSD